MSPFDALRAYLLLGLPAGLATGLALGLVARRPRGWGGYASFRRRAARLGHVATVMLPLIGGAYALLLAPGAVPSAPLAWAAGLWIGGGVVLCAALFLAAWRPRLLVLLPFPAVAVTAAAVLFAWVGFSG